MQAATGYMKRVGHSKPLCIKVAGGGQQLFHDFSVGCSGFEALLCTTERYAYSPEILETIVDIEGEFQHEPVGSVSHQCARYLAYSGLSDVIFERMSFPQLSDRIDSIAFSDEIRSLTPDKSKLFRSDISELLGSSSLGLTCAIISTYRPKGGCKSFASFMKVNNGKVDEGIGFIKMNNPEFDRAKQNEMSALLAKNVAFSTDRECDPQEVSKSRSQLESFVCVENRGFVNPSDCHDIALQLSEGSQADSSDNDGAYVWSFEHDNNTDTWGYNAINRKRFDSRHSDHILYHGPSKLWIENPKLIDTDCLDVICVPGSFNPLHPGHLRMAASAKKYLESTLNTRKVCSIFEIAMKRYDKGHDDILGVGEKAILDRLQLFSDCNILFLIYIVISAIINVPDERGAFCGQSLTSSEDYRE